MTEAHPGGGCHRGIFRIPGPLPGYEWTHNTLAAAGARLTTNVRLNGRDFVTLVV